MREQTPLIRRFRILGLHGYKDMELEFRGPVRIVIAENGTGKTTFLNVLSNFLQGNFARLRSLSFDTIECEFSSRTKALVLSRRQLPDKVDASSEATLTELAQFANVHPSDLERVLLESDSIHEPEISTHPVLRDIYFNSPYSKEHLVSQFQELRASADRIKSDELKQLTSDIQDATSDYEILYLPTYRRVELSQGRRDPRMVRAIAPQSALRRSREFKRIRRGSVGIQYGLSDVESRLFEIQHEVQSQSNVGYRVISANIIDDLLGARLASPASRSELPDIQSLSLFFSRIERHGAAENRLKTIRDLYETGEITQPKHETLRYFLGKLSRVVDKTKELEASVEKFVDKANEYLVQSSDEKRLQYDATRMNVVVKNLWTNDRVKMDDLSSGEKQVISLLAHMYLYERKKIVLIDEPELSLSIDWQRRLLPDVLSSPNCEQLLAITHSPFIFDNDLDPYAGPIKITRRKAPKE